MQRKLPYGGISKSTVHKDVTDALKHVDPIMHAKVRDVLERNKQERHLRGGEATRRKYSYNSSHPENKVN